LHTLFTFKGFLSFANNLDNFNIVKQKFLPIGPYNQLVLKIITFGYLIINCSDLYFEEP
mgnify:CR=1